MAGKGGGQWKVAYADFVTAMMAFFMVMWITAQSDKVKQAVAHYFNYPTAFRGAAPTGRKGPAGQDCPVRAVRAAPTSILPETTAMPSA